MCTSLVTWQALVAPHVFCLPCWKDTFASHAAGCKSSAISNYLVVQC
jgi:hypothetical protein